MFILCEAAGLVEMADGYRTTSRTIKLKNILFTWKMEVMDVHRQIPTMVGITVALHRVAVSDIYSFYLH